MNIKLSKKAKLKPFGQEEIGIGVASPPAPLQRARGVITQEAEILRKVYLLPSLWERERGEAPDGAVVNVLDECRTRRSISPSARHSGSVCPSGSMPCMIR